MNAAQLKNDLHRYIVETDDINILSKLKEAYLSFRKAKEDWWDTISEEERKGLKLGLEDAKKGNTISDEEVRKQINEKIQKLKQARK